MLNQDLSAAIANAESAKTAEDLRRETLNYYIAAVFALDDEKPRKSGHPTRPEIVSGAIHILDIYTQNSVPTVYELKWLFELLTGHTSQRRNDPKTDPRKRETLIKIDAAKELAGEHPMSQNMMAKFLMVSRRTISLWREQNGYREAIETVKGQLRSGEKLPVFNPRADA